MIDIDTFKAVLPKNVKPTEAALEHLNRGLDQDTAESMRDNLLGYAHVLSDGSIKLTDYINAVKYVSYKMMENSNYQAWVKTFPDRFERLKNQGKSAKDISAHVAMYNKNKIVTRVLAEAAVPTHILNQDIFQKAINIQAELMSDPDNSAHVRTQAANSLLTHLKAPEAQKVELDMTVKDDRLISELKDITLGLAAQQKKMIESGARSVTDIAHQQIVVEGEYEEVR